jgi:hypothetical protein
MVEKISDQKKQRNTEREREFKTKICVFNSSDKDLIGQFSMLFQ